jgi:hypothetical protein
MATLASLKLVTAKKPSNQAPIVQRRNKLCAKIFEQLALAKAQNAGETYSPTRTKTVTNTDGERVQVSVPKRIKPWWFVGENGKVCISIRYGAKVIAITPKANAIEVNSPAALIEALETVGTAVQAGELDSQIEAVSGQIRSAFNK